MIHTKIVTCLLFKDIISYIIMQSSVSTLNWILVYLASTYGVLLLLYYLGVGSHFIFYSAKNSFHFKLSLVYRTSVQI